MKATCPRCGRPLGGSGSGMSAPGATPAVACACGGEGMHSAAADGGERRRKVDPLEAPSAGSVEIDPWSVPPPEGGYESLELEEGRAPAEPAAAEGATVAGPETDAGEPAPAEDDAAPEPAAPARPRSRAPLAIAAAVAVVGVAVAAWLVLGRSGDRARPSVRVRVTEEVTFGAPPLAPIDPSYVERARPAEPAPQPVAAPAPHTAPPRGRASAQAPAAAPVAAQALPPPPPAPVPVSEEPAAAREVPPAESAPAKAAAAAELPAIPLPPPPVPAPAPAAAPARPARTRAPALQTRSCVEDALRVPRGLEGRLPSEVVLTVDVGADGRPGEVAVAGSVDSRLASALAVAVRTCRFTPGEDGSGRPAAGRATMRLRFEP